MAKKTRLYDVHVRHGGKIVDFFDWNLPVQFKGIISEHEAVRTKAGLFDVSHMGEFFLEGKDAQAFLQRVVTNNVKKIVDFQCQYTPMCYENGTTVDDLLIYRFSENRYMLVVNAANLESDFAWLQSQKTGEISLQNVSADYGQLALQGPDAGRILADFTGHDFSDLRFYHFCTLNHQGNELIISRTGYTGEDGFEIYFPGQKGIEEFAEGLLARDDVTPTGLGARDTLRFEAKLPLYGHELSDQITPVEAGLKSFCDLEGDYFIGCEVLKAQAAEKPARRIIGLEMSDRSAPRTGYEVYAEENGEAVGFITSGSFCPSLGKTCALALVKKGVGKIGSEFFVDIRGRKKSAVMIKTPFYARSKN
jgi:aminomethyltransferase